MVLTFKIIKNWDFHLDKSKELRYYMMIVHYHQRFFWRFSCVRIANAVETAGMIASVKNPVNFPRVAVDAPVRPKILRFAVVRRRMKVKTTSIRVAPSTTTDPNRIPNVRFTAICRCTRGEKESRKKNNSAKTKRLTRVSRFFYPVK